MLVPAAGAKPVDVHVHLAALPTPSNGCLLSKRMRGSLLVRLIASGAGLPLDDPETANRLYLERLAAELDASSEVSGAVLLAMDGAYDAAGRLDEARTEFLVPNDAVLAAAKASPRLLPGVSIHPGRRDALDELARCAEAGAALVKVLPNVQGFSPDEHRLRPFWRELARRRLPVLAHVGWEFSLVGQDQSLGDLRNWRTALEEGVTLIAAHGGSNGTFLGEPQLPVLREFLGRYPRFYADSSALGLPNRVGALFRLRRIPELRERLLFGTDYPLPCFAYPCLFGGDWEGWRRARALPSRFDRHAAVLRSLGLPAERGYSPNLAAR